jgi:hypothetical protein
MPPVAADDTIKLIYAAVFVLVLLLTPSEFVSSFDKSEHRVVIAEGPVCFRRATAASGMTKPQDDKQPTLIVAF